MNSIQQDKQSKEKSRSKLVNLCNQILTSVRFQKYFKLSFLIIFCIIELLVLSFKIFKIKHFSEIQNDLIVYLIIIIIAIIMIPLISYNIINNNFEEVLFCCLLGCLFESFLIDQQKMLRLCAFFIFSQRTMKDIQKLQGNKVTLFIIVLYPAIRFSIENIPDIYSVIQNVLLLLINSLFSIVKHLKNNKMQKQNSETILQNSHNNNKIYLNDQTDQSNFIQNGLDAYGILSDPQQLNQTKHDQSNINYIFNYMNNNHITFLNDEDPPYFNSYNGSKIKQTQENRNQNNIFQKKEINKHKNNNNQNLKFQDLQNKLDKDNNQQQLQNNFAMDWILNQISTGIILLDNNKKLVYSNKPLKKIINRSKIFGNISELTYFLSFKLQFIQKFKTQFNDSLEKIINQNRNKSPKKNIHEQNFQTNTKFDQFFEEQKQKRENDNQDKTKCIQKQDQYGQVSYNQYQTSKNIQQMKRQNYLSAEQQDYRKTTTVEVFSSDQHHDNIQFSNKKIQNPSLNTNINTSQQPQLLKLTKNLSDQHSNQGLIQNLEYHSDLSFMSSEIKPISLQYSKVVQCIIPQNISKLFTKENLQLDDIIDFLMKFSSPPQYLKKNTSVDVLTEQSEESISYLSYKQQKNLDSIGKIQSSILSLIEAKQNKEVLDLSKQMKQVMKNDKKSIHDRNQKEFKSQNTIKQEEGSIVFDGKTDNQIMQKKKKERKNLYDYFILNNQLHLTIQQEENDLSQEDVTVFEIKLSVLLQNDFEKNKFILIEISDITKLIKQIDHESLDIYKNKLLSSVSHELRTPLNCSIQMLDMLSQNDEISNIIKQVFILPALNSNLLLLNIINDILDLAQINYGKFTMIFSEFELNQICTECINLISMQALQKELQIELDFDPNVPEIIHSDSIRIRQVLLNLLSNALKFTQSGKIAISTKLIDERLIQIDIQDSGCGISEKNLKSLYQKFNQTDIFHFDYFQKSCQSNSINIGLGLTIANNLAAGLGGNRKLSVQSEENVGTKFSFWIVNHSSHKIGCKFTKKNIFNKEIIKWKSILDNSPQQKQQQYLQIQNYSFKQDTNNNNNGQQQLNQSIKSKFKNDESSNYLKNSKYSLPVQQLIKFNYDVLQNQSNYNQSVHIQNNQSESHQNRESFTNSTFNKSLIESKKINKFQLSFKDQSLLSEDQGTIFENNNFTQYSVIERAKSIGQIISKIQNQENYQRTDSIQKMESLTQGSNFDFEQKQQQITQPKQVSQLYLSLQSKFHNNSDSVSNSTLQNLSERNNQEDNLGIYDQNNNKIQNKQQNKAISQYPNIIQTQKSIFCNLKNQNENKNIKANEDSPSLIHMSYANQSIQESINPQTQNQLKYEIYTMQKKLRLSLFNELNEEQYNIINLDDSQKIQRPNQNFCYKVSEKRKQINNQSFDDQNNINNQQNKTSDNEIGLKIEFLDNNSNQTYEQGFQDSYLHKKVNFSLNSFSQKQDDDMELEINCNNALGNIQTNNQHIQYNSNNVKMIGLNQTKTHVNQRDTNKIQKYVNNNENFKQQSDKLPIFLSSQPIKQKNELKTPHENYYQNDLIDLDMNNQNQISQSQSPQQSKKLKIQDYNNLRKCQCSNILIVDDNDFNIYALEIRLKSYGFIIDRANSGIIALEKINKKYEGKKNCCQIYTLIFMDIEMPIKNGYETTKDIFTYYSEKKIVKPPVISACSAFVQQSEQDQASQSGMKYYITKPVNQLRLEEVLISVIFDAKIQNIQK